MFFRDKKSPSGTVLQLVEAFRNDEGQARQKIVTSLGCMRVKKEIRRDVAKAVEARLYDERYLEELLAPESCALVDRIARIVLGKGTWSPARARRVQEDDQQDSAVIDGVQLDRINQTQATTLGPELLALHAWNALNMTPCLKTLGFSDDQATSACVSVISRLVAPCSEHFLQNFLMTSSLPDLLGQQIMQFADDRYYRVSDKLLASKDRIEAHLRRAQKACFNLQRTIVLYDLTNTHFEGACKLNPKAKRGKNKQKRNDCPQVVVGMVFDEFGFELAHKTYAGNTQDSTTLAHLVDTLGKLTATDPDLADTKPVVIVDAGIATKANLRELREKGFSYLVNASRQQRTSYAAQFADDSGFEEVPDRTKNDKPRPAVLVKSLDHYINEDGETVDADAEAAMAERLVLCKSASRADKERAIISKAEERLLDDLQKLASRISNKRIRDTRKINQAIGRLSNRHSRAAKFYQVTYTPDPEATKDQAPGVLHYARESTSYDTAQSVMGCYALRTDLAIASAVELWQLYITLEHAEEGFRMLKGDLGLRPNFHQTEDRVDGHIFITVLAYQLLSYIHRVLRQHNDMRSWRAIRTLLQSHCYATLTVPTISGTTYRDRKPGTPEASQAQIYRYFGISTTSLPSTRTVLQSQK